MKFEMKFREKTFDEQLQDILTKGETFKEKHDKEFLKELTTGAKDASIKARETGEEQMIEGITLYGKNLWIKP